MRAIVQDTYGPPDVLRLEDVATPVPKDMDVLVRVRAAGVDRGVWHVMTGLPYLVRLMGLRRPRTRIRGMDLAGTVEAVGANVRRFKPGDDVFGACDGSFAEFACAKEDSLAPKPARLTFEEAAAVAVSGTTALQGLRDKGELQAGQSVLVTGASGGVGTFAVQLARSLGAEVTGVCSTTKVDLVRSIGADHVVDYTREDFTDGPRQYDVILDTAGNRPLSHLRRVLTPEGTLVIVGGEGGGAWLGGTDRQLRAIALSPFVRQKLRPFLAQVRRDDLEFLRARIEAGTVRPVIDRIYPLGQAADAIRYLAEGHARGKIALTV